MALRHILRHLGITTLSLGVILASNYSLAAKRSTDDINSLYLKNRDALIASYQQQGLKLAKEYVNYKPAATAPAAPGVHAKRYLMTYVNDIGIEQYTQYSSNNANMPVGTIIAKESFKLKGDKFKAGPLFFMEKVANNDAPKTDGWVYHVINPNGSAKKVSQKFCHSCHQAYQGQDSLGYPALEVRIATAKQESTQKTTPTHNSQAFAACAGCHQVGANAQNAFGPTLNGVIGRKAASAKGFEYSADLMAARDKGLVWNKENISQWIKDPKAFLNAYLNKQDGFSKMPIGFANLQQRENVIRYLDSNPQ